MRIFTLVVVGIVAAGGMIGSSNAARAQMWITCATEGQTCYVPYPWMTVTYGKDGAVATKSGVTAVQCADSTSGFDRDPLVGQPKTCLLFFNDGSATWKYCAPEGAMCDLRSNRLVRFGDENGNVWVYGSFGAPFFCTRDVFGDPAYGVLKVCQVME